MIVASLVTTAAIPLAGSFVVLLILAFTQRRAINVRTTSAIQRRIDRMTDEGLAWRELDESEMKIELAGTSVVGMSRLGGLRCDESIVLGTHVVDDESAQVRLFDWMYLRRRSRGIVLRGFQTVAIVRPAQLVDLPDFFFQPRLTSTLPCAGVSHHFESSIEYRAQMLFETSFGDEILNRYITDRDWTVEWTGEQLLVLQQNQVVAGEDLGQFISEVLELVNLLPGAEAALRESFDRRVEFASCIASTS